jgi:hypothetical protein
MSLSANWKLDEMTRGLDKRFWNLVGGQGLARPWKVLLEWCNFDEYDLRKGTTIIASDAEVLCELACFAWIQTACLVSGSITSGISPSGMEPVLPGSDGVVRRIRRNEVVPRLCLRKVRPDDGRVHTARQTKRAAQPRKQVRIVRHRSMALTKHAESILLFKNTSRFF